MGLVLDTKYGTHYKTFILSRALRIYPLYFFVLSISLILILSASIWKGHPVDRLNFYVEAYMAGHSTFLSLLMLIQFIIIGTDLPCLLSYNPDVGVFIATTGHPIQGILIERMLFLPQSWTISFELIFYILAPWLVKFKTKTLLTLIVFSLFIKIALRVYYQDFIPSKWDQQFLPPQFGFFLIGLLTYRKRSFLLAKTNKILLGLGILLLAILFIEWIRLPYSLAEAMWYLILIPITPKLFEISSDSGLDSWLGNLSYPIYLIHIPVRWVMLGPSGGHGGEISPALFVIYSVLAALALTLTVENSLERFRANFIRSQLQK